MVRWVLWIGGGGGGVGMFGGDGGGDDMFGGDGGKGEQKLCEEACGDPRGETISVMDWRGCAAGF